MSLGVQLEAVLLAYRKWRRERQHGPLGEFYRNGGDDQLTTDLRIKGSDIVIDVGGYRGDFAAKILERYGARVLLLEPLPVTQGILHNRFHRNARVELLTAALGADDGSAELEIADDSSSIVTSARPGASRVKVAVVGVASLITRLGDAEVGCIKLNIEGAEYDVLERMIDLGFLSKVRAVLIQFHVGVPHAEERRLRIREELAKTHREAFCFDFVWELWIAREE